MTIIKNRKINFLAIIGMMVAFGTFAFKAPKSNELIWFEVISNIIQVENETDGPNVDCSLAPAAKTCMVGFETADLDPNGHAPTTNPASPLVKERAYTNLN